MQDVLYEDPKVILQQLGDEQPSSSLLKDVGMITKLIMKEQTLELSEKNNIVSQLT